MPLMSAKGDFTIFDVAEAPLDSASTVDIGFAMLPKALANSLQKGSLPADISWLFASSLTVGSVPSLNLRLSGDSADDSGVVPHDESRAWDIEEAGDPVMDVDEPCRPLGRCALPLVLLILAGLAMPFIDVVVVPG